MKGTSKTAPSVGDWSYQRFFVSDRTYKLPLSPLGAIPLWVRLLPPKQKPTLLKVSWLYHSSQKSKFFFIKRTATRCYQMIPPSMPHIFVSVDSTILCGPNFSSPTPTSSHPLRPILNLSIWYGSQNCIANRLHRSELLSCLPPVKLPIISGSRLIFPYPSVRI